MKYSGTHILKIRSINANPNIMQKALYFVSYSPLKLNCLSQGLSLQTTMREQEAPRNEGSIVQNTYFTRSEYFKSRFVIFGGPTLFGCANRFV
jgi:hypothetical protein